MAVTRDARAPPTTLLPPLKRVRSVDRGDLLLVFSELRVAYCPPIHGFAHAPTSQSQTASYDDAFERNHTIKWLTGFVALYSEDESYDDLVREAAGVLAICSGSSAQGVVKRAFGFGHVQVTLQDASRDTDAAGSNVGLQTWGSSYILASKLVRDPGLLTTNAIGDRLRILELGAGTGLVSLVLAKILPPTATIIATDYHPDVLQNLRANVIANDVVERVCVRALDWREFLDHPRVSSPEDGLAAPFDVIVAADVVYEAEQCSWLSACVSSLLRPAQGNVPSGVFHLVVPVRPTHAVESGLIEAAFPPYDPNATYHHSTLVSCRKEELSPEPSTPMASTVAYRYYSITWSS